MGRRAIRQPHRSIESDPLYIGKPRRHDKRAMRAVTAAGGIDQMQSGPSFYHPDFEPSSILLPQDQTERNNWTRYFYKNDPIVATAIDLHAELPLSKIKLAMPKGRDKDRNRRILEYFVRMIGPQGCNLFSKLLQLAVEYNKLGNVFMWIQFSDDGKWVQSLNLLDPDFIAAEKLEWVSGAMTAELVPNENIKTIIANGVDHPTTGALCRRIPPDLRELVAAQQNIPLNTDPRLGSHLAHIARKQNDYDKWGVSLIERCFKNLVFKDRLRQAQDAIAARHMTPKHLIYAEGSANADIEELRQQVDAALNDPDYAIISNYQIVWELIGTAQSFINVADEWNYMNDEILMGLQMNKAFLQGEASYAGGQAVLQLMEQRYAVFRTVVEDFIYTHIFIPVCEAMGYYEIDKDDSGNEIKQYLYPEVKWNRLNLTDDTPHKQMLAQMVTEGKVDVATWLELFGLDPDSIMENLEKEQFTPFDPNFSAMQQAIYAAMADRLAPALAEKRAMEMGIEIDLGAGGPGGGMGGPEGGGLKFGSSGGTVKTADGQFALDDGSVSTKMILQRVAAQMTADMMEGWKREKALVEKEAESADEPEGDLHKESETVEERRIERRRKRMERQQESAKDRFEVTQEAKKKPPRTDMWRKKKDWGIKTRKPVAGMPELAPLLGNGTDADRTAEEAADFAASLPGPLVSVAKRFEEAVCRRGSAVCNVFYPQLIALAATEPGLPIEDRIEQVESRYGEEIEKGSDSLRRRLDRLSKIEDPALREQGVRQAIRNAITNAVRTFRKTGG